MLPAEPPGPPATHPAGFVSEFGVSVIGECCGSGDEHLKAVVDRCHDLEPARRQPVHEAGAASIYTRCPSIRTRGSSSWGSGPTPRLARVPRRHASVDEVVQRVNRIGAGREGLVQH